jgi:Ca2+-binding EF-hand superfamily protein
MNSRKLITTLALSLAAAVPAALADTPKAKVDPTAAVDKWFPEYDTNRDGKVSREEFRMGSAYFAGLDADKDGFLTRDEAKAALTSQPVEVDLEAVDADRDGYVTRREWPGDQAGFDKLDLDNDGVLSKLDRDLERSQARAKGRLKKFDKNGDGLVQREEWPMDDSSFRQQDKNRNGTISVDELLDQPRRKQ